MLMVIFNCTVKMKTDSGCTGKLNVKDLYKIFWILKFQIIVLQIESVKTGHEFDYMDKQNV